MKEINVLLAEDHQNFRDGMRSLLASDESLKMVGEASNAREAADLARQLHPTIAVMNVSLPEANGREAIQQILLAAPDTRVLAVIANNYDVYVAKMTAIGTSAYEVKHVSREVLFQVINEIASRQDCLNPSLA
jgi:DNA-binding NarL/FixJ family response regulator